MKRPIVCAYVYILVKSGGLDSNRIPYKKWHMPFFSQTLRNIYEERSQTRLTLLIIKLYAPHPAGGIFTLRPIIRPGQTTRGKL